MAINQQKFLPVLPKMVQLSVEDIRDYLARLYMRASWKFKGLSIASTARLHYRSRSQIRLLGNSWIGNFSVVLISDPDNAIPPPLLEIGNNVYIGEQANIRAAGGIIQIGNNVLIANQVTIVASNHGIKLGKPMISQAWQRGDVLIEDDVWIAAGVVVLPGVIIRHGAVIAAGAVVKGEVPSNTIFGGVPARQIGLRS